jgi:hypothetical protein
MKILKLKCWIRIRNRFKTHDTTALEKKKIFQLSENPFKELVFTSYQVIVGVDFTALYGKILEVPAWDPSAHHKNKNLSEQILHLQCCGSMTFWYGPGSGDPCL